MRDQIAARSGCGVRRTIDRGHDIQIEQSRAVTKAIEEVRLAR
jgi:hypothetical protein